MNSRKQWKVCGMRDKKNIVEVAAFRPDFMGFIFYEKSPRFVGVGFDMPADIPPSVKKVGVFVNAPTREILATWKKFGLFAAQLHGDEQVDQCNELTGQGVRVVKAFRIDEKFEFQKLEAFEPVVEFFLFDTKGAHYGGNAAVFDWRLLSRYTGSKQYFLSGGLSPVNLRDAMTIDDPRLIGLDLNSGLEWTPGMKDLKKVADVNTFLKNYNNSYEIPG